MQSPSARTVDPMSARSTAEPLRSATTHLAPSPRASSKSVSRAPARSDTTEPLATTSTGSGPGSGAFRGRLQRLLVSTHPSEGVRIHDVGDRHVGAGLPESARRLLPTRRPNGELFGQKRREDAGF